MSDPDERPGAGMEDEHEGVAGENEYDTPGGTPYVAERSALESSYQAIFGTTISQDHLTNPETGNTLNWDIDRGYTDSVTIEPVDYWDSEATDNS